MAFAASLAALSLLGPLVAGVIDRRITPTILSRLHGLDAVSLGIVAPPALLAGVLALRGRPLGALLGLAPAAYAAYMVPPYVLGPDHLRLPGNNEQWFPLMLAVFVLALVGFRLAWRALDDVPLAFASHTERLVARRLLPGAAVLVFSRYPAGLAELDERRPHGEGRPRGSRVRMDDRAARPRHRAAGDRGRARGSRPR